MIRYFVPIMALVCFLSYGCKGPPSTQDRTIAQLTQPGGSDVLKVCTERPQSYTASVETQLKAVLPLLGKTGVEAEGTVKAFLDQQPRGTQRGEDLNNYLFYICQMANNGNWPAATTERLINRFLEIGWAEKDPPSKFKPTQDSLSDRLVRTCKQPTVGLNRRPAHFVPYWFEYLHMLKEEKFEGGRDLQNLYYIKGRYRDHLYAPEDVFAESLYTLKCLEDMGAVKLEKLGTTGKYQEKAFENQRIVFQ